VSEEDLRIRGFREGDYPLLVEVDRAVFPERSWREENYRQADENKPEKCLQQRYVALLGDEVIGHGYFTQLEWSYEPGKFFISLKILPDYQGRGFGREFFLHLLAELEPHDPCKLESYTRENKPRAVRFLRDRGFEETGREWEQELQLDDFEAEKFAGILEKVRARGYSLTSLAELNIDENLKRELYELVEEVNQDIPSPVEYTGVDYDSFSRTFARVPGFYPAGYIIARQDEVPVGISSHYRRPDGSTLYVTLTGVRREHRGRGLATAMKVKAAETARREGFKRITATNEIEHEAMLHINEKLGFVKKPAWISFARKLT